MIAVRSDGDHTRAEEAVDRDRSRRTDTGAVTELSASVFTPRRHRTVDHEGEGVRIAGGDRGRDVEPGHTERNRGLDRGTDAELPFVVISPGPDGAVRRERDAVTPACRMPRDVVDSNP